MVKAAAWSVLPHLAAFIHSPEVSPCALYRPTLQQRGMSLYICSAAFENDSCGTLMLCTLPALHDDLVIAYYVFDNVPYFLTVVSVL